MKYFEVPYCNGALRFDPKYFEIISEEVRERDLIKFLLSELENGNNTALKKSENN